MNALGCKLTFTCRASWPCRRRLAARSPGACGQSAPADSRAATPASSRRRRPPGRSRRRSSTGRGGQAGWPVRRPPAPEPERGSCEKSAVYRSLKFSQLSWVSVTGWALGKAPDWASERTLRAERVEPVPTGISFAAISFKLPSSNAGPTAAGWTSRCDPSTAARRSGCARTSCCTCWPTTSSGTCEKPPVSRKPLSHKDKLALRPGELQATAQTP